MIQQKNGKTYACLRSDPIDMDTDGDGIIDGRDSEVLTWNMSDRDYAMFAKLAYLDSWLTMGPLPAAIRPRRR
ncbi:MAG: hypothetical protein ACLSAP_06040 [Oscillospiraceae bacterium]